MSTTPRQMRSWAVENGYPEQAGKHGRLPDQVIAAYWTAHPDEAVAPTVLPDFDTAPDDPWDGPDYLIVANAWDGDHAGAIAQAAADLIGAVHASTKARIVAELREHVSCGCFTQAIESIEAMS